MTKRESSDEPIDAWASVYAGPLLRTRWTNAVAGGAVSVLAHGLTWSCYYTLASSNFDDPLDRRFFAWLLASVIEVGVGATCLTLGIVLVTRGGMIRVRGLGVLAGLAIGLLGYLASSYTLFSWFSSQPPHAR